MGKIKIGRMVLGVCQTNCYFVYREGEKTAVIFDVPDEGEKICNTLEKNGFSVAGIFLTHGHFDHIWGCKELKNAANKKAQKYGTETVKVYVGEEEKTLLSDAHKNVSEQMGRPYTMDADVYVKDTEEITVGGITFKAIATPGHTVGGYCYYIEEAGILISGDTLFQESVGRTDFPTGSMGTLVRSIKEKLFILPEETKVYPGHGAGTTIGEEKKYNPFCA